MLRWLRLEGEVELVKGEVWIVDGPGRWFVVEFTVR